LVGLGVAHTDGDIVIFEHVQFVGNSGEQSCRGTSNSMPEKREESNPCSSGPRGRRVFIATSTNSAPREAFPAERLFASFVLTLTPDGLSYRLMFLRFALPDGLAFL